MPLTATGQGVRAAHQFALVVYAGELATQWGLTDWSASTAQEAALACFANGSPTVTARATPNCVPDWRRCAPLSKPTAKAGSTLAEPAHPFHPNPQPRRLPP
jgi:hypothetical protein